MPRPRQGQGGFTLLEVMIAVAVIAIALVTMIGAQAQSVDIAAIARFDTDAALLAQHQLTELLLAREESMGSDQGDFGDDYPAYGWRTEVMELGEDEVGFKGSGYQLVAIDLTVYLLNQEDTSFTLRQILYLPER
jgi:general secretion pathway protein I